MDIHQLRIFTSIYRNRSFTKASLELCLTQPTVSDHIKTLEEEFECRLFDRLGRTIMPTKAAEVLYVQAMDIIEKADSLKTILGELKKDVTGELIIGASTIPGTYLMPAIMAAFQEKYPAVSFNLPISGSGEIINKVLRYELLLGIVGSRLDNDQIHYSSFMDDELIVLAAPFLVVEEEITLEELVSLPIVLREEGSGTRKETVKILEGKGISLKNMKITGIFGSTEAVKQAVKAGIGISILSRLAVADELERKTLREIKIRGIEMKRKFYVATRKRRTLPTAYNVFLEHFMAGTKII